MCEKITWQYENNSFVQISLTQNTQRLIRPLFWKRVPKEKVLGVNSNVQARNLFNTFQFHPLGKSLTDITSNIGYKKWPDAYFQVVYNRLRKIWVPVVSKLLSTMIYRIHYILTWYFCSQDKQCLVHGHSYGVLCCVQIRRWVQYQRNTTSFLTKAVK